MCYWQLRLVSLISGNKQQTCRWCTCWNRALPFRFTEPCNEIFFFFLAFTYFLLSGFTPVFLGKSPQCPGSSGTLRYPPTVAPGMKSAIGWTVAWADLSKPFSCFATGKFAPGLLMAPSEESPPVFLGVVATSARENIESGSTLTTAVLLWHINTSTLKASTTKQQQNK